MAADTARRPLRAAPLGRVGFWRALAEAVGITTLLALLRYPLAARVGPPWPDLLIYPLLLVYVWLAWRLEPGRGSLWRRTARLLGWLALLGAAGGTLAWLIATLLPYPGRQAGPRGLEAGIALPLYLFNTLLIAGGLVMPPRLLLALWGAGRLRLRWQLTFSYVLVGVLTTALIPLALGVLVGVTSLMVVPVAGVRLEQADRTAALLAPLVRRDVAPARLEALLQSLLAGHARVPASPGLALDQVRDQLNVQAVRRITLLRPDGTVLASAGAERFAPGQPLPPADETDLALPLEHARPGGCVAGRPSDGPVADLAVCRIAGPDGSAAVLLIETPVELGSQWGLSIARIVSVTLLGTNLALVIALMVVVVVLGLALGGGYLLARRLTRRLEDLAAATGALAAGRLDPPVPVDRRDEVGRLSADFNAMAGRLREREQALLAEKERAERLLAANRRLVADVSHELRTPLTTMRGYLEAMELSHGDLLPAHDMRVIQGELSRLTRLIEDLFTLARADAQQLPLTIAPVDAAALVRRLGDALGPLARRERQIELVDALPPALPPVCADGARLEQVLLNLLQNALRHTPPGGIVAFEGRAEGGQVTISVADTGVGISAEELPLVFERFYRGDPSRARETGGAGLGLALVRELVTAMGGSVSAESTPQRGSRFSVTLRRAPDAEAPARL